MNPEGVIEAFVATIMLGVMVVVSVYILNPDIGQILIGILPIFVEGMVYILIIVVMIAMVLQLLVQE